MSATRLTVPHPPDSCWHDGATVKFLYCGKWIEGIVTRVKPTGYWQDDELQVDVDGKTYYVSAMGLVAQMTCHPFEVKDNG